MSSRHQWTLRRPYMRLTETSNVRNLYSLGSNQVVAALLSQAAVPIFNLAHSLGPCIHGDCYGSKMNETLGFRLFERVNFGGTDRMLIKPPTPRRRQGPVGTLSEDDYIAT